MNEKPKIDNVVEEKIDSKIHDAQLPERTKESAAINLPATTTVEEDKKTAGQRNVNLIWETTQALLALGITSAVIYTALTGINSQILNTAFVLVISMYLVRTNHTKTGGVGGTDSR